MNRIAPTTTAPVDHNSGIVPPWLTPVDSGNSGIVPPWLEPSTLPVARPVAARDVDTLFVHEPIDASPNALLQALRAR